jgi:pimeloyl-ACP methyl ester carboxylesterase
MNSTSNPIGLFDKLNASVLLAVTPEYGRIKAARRKGAGRIASISQPAVMQTQYRTIAGVKVRFAEGGKQDGPVVLLLSPLPQSILCYDAIWNRIGEQCRLVALDLPGFGRSEGGIEFMSFEAQSRFLDEFVRAFDLKRMHIVGPDVGMAAALHYAIHRDHEAASLLIGDGPGILPTMNGSIINKAVNSGFWRMMFKITGAGAFVEGAIRLALVNYSPSAQEVEDYVTSYKGRIGPITHWFATYPENLAKVDPYLAELDLPVKVFWGDLDQFLLLDNARRLDQRLKRSELQIFKNCGHFSYQDKAEEFADMIQAWVGGGYREV